MLAPPHAVQDGLGRLWPMEPGFPADVAWWGGGSNFVWQLVDGSQFAWDYVRSTRWWLVFPVGNSKKSWNNQSVNPCPGRSNPMQDSHTAIVPSIKQNLTDRWNCGWTNLCQTIGLKWATFQAETISNLQTAQTNIHWFNQSEKYTSCPTWDPATTTNYSSWFSDYHLEGPSEPPKVDFVIIIGVTKSLITEQNLVAYKPSSRWLNKIYITIFASHLEDQQIFASHL